MRDKHFINYSEQSKLLQPERQIDCRHVGDVLLQKLESCFDNVPLHLFIAGISQWFAGSEF